MQCFQKWYKSNICDKKVETHLLFREIFINLY